MFNAQDVIIYFGCNSLPLHDGGSLSNNCLPLSVSQRKDKLTICDPNMFESSQLRLISHFCSPLGGSFAEAFQVKHNLVSSNNISQDSVLN